MEDDVKEPLTAIEEIEIERVRQIAEEGWTYAHDDDHIDRALAAAAACYALAASAPIEGNSSVFEQNIKFGEAVKGFWPWDWKWWKPSSRRQNLIKAGALIVAEIERIDRAAKKAST